MTRICFLLSAVVFCLLLPSCKKDGGDELKKPTVADLTKMLNIQEEAVLKYEESWKASHDTLTAIFDAGQWLLKQPEVKDVYLTDDWYLSIIYNSGLRSSISVTMIGAGGQHLRRGGGGEYAKGSIRTYTLGGKGKQTLDDKLIANKKVLIMNPYEDDFFHGAYPFLPLFDKSKTKLDVTVVSNDAATFKVFKTVGDYGLIILNTHGGPDGTLQLYTSIPKMDIPSRPDPGKWTEAEVSDYVSQSGQELLGLLLSGKLRWGTITLLDLFNATKPIVTNIQIEVTDEYISGMSGQLKEAVVFGNHCFSGNTVNRVIDGKPLGNMPEAWLKAGAAAYYGYAFDGGGSSKVDNLFCVDMEDSLINNLVVNGDSTGIAHLAGDVTPQGYLNYYTESKRGADKPMGLVFKPARLDSLYYTRTGKIYLKLFTARATNTAAACLQTRATHRLISWYV